MTLAADTLHATTVAIDGRGVLIEGPSGSGKSDLALRLIDRGAVLVSDDRTVVAPVAGRLMASPPSIIAGRMEVRGVGIVAVAHVERAPVALIVRLAAAPDRLPEPSTRTIDGITVAELVLDPREGSAPIKVEFALRRTEDPA